MTALPTPTRWADPAWQAAALRWVDAALDAQGIVRRGWTLPHVRPWSAAMRIETDADPVWLKANGEGTSYEPALLAAMAELDLPHTPRPLAVDVARGLTLLPDGGPTSRSAHGGLTPLVTTAEIFAAYAGLQRASEPHVERFVGLGIVDLRPDRMPAALVALVAELRAETPPARLEDADATGLLALVPAYADACGELAACGIPAALQHDDLHSNNVFERGPVFFDWGDCCVGHPFGTLLAGLRSVAHHHGLGPDDPWLSRIADAYTEAWTDVADRSTLRRAVLLAIRLGPLTRALAWRRALRGVDTEARAEDGDAPAGWLLELHEPALPLLPALLR